MTGVARRRILVVDDEPAVVRALVRILARAYDVVPANGGVLAVALLKDDAAFDLILCDLMMPDMDGIAVHGRVTATNPELADRFLFMSGGVFSDRARSFVADGKRVILDKPFDMAEVQKVVAAAFASR